MEREWVVRQFTDIARLTGCEWATHARNRCQDFWERLESLGVNSGFYSVICGFLADNTLGLGRYEGSQRTPNQAEESTNNDPKGKGKEVWKPVE